MYNLSAVNALWRNYFMFVQRLKEIRKSRGFTSQQMADILEISSRSYRRYESGDRQPSFDTLIQIADKLNVSLDYLFGRDNYQSAP